MHHLYLIAGSTLIALTTTFGREIYIRSLNLARIEQDSLSFHVFYNQTKGEPVTDPGTLSKIVQGSSNVTLGTALYFAVNLLASTLLLVGFKLSLSESDGMVTILIILGLVPLSIIYVNFKGWRDIYNQHYEHYRLHRKHKYLKESLKYARTKYNVSTP